MNKQKEFAKISVLIDKLNYLNDNLDYNNFNPNNIDFRLLKKYVDDIQLKLAEIGDNTELEQESIINQNIILPINPSIEKTQQEINNVDEKEINVIKESEIQIEEELVPHKEVQSEITKETIINADDGENDITYQAEKSDENHTTIKEVAATYKEPTVETDSEINKDKLYDLYEMNDNDSALTKVSDIVKKEELGIDENENIQQDILETISAIKSGNNISEALDNTQTDLKVEKEINSLDSIIVDSASFENNVEKKNELNAIEQNSKISFQDEYNNEDNLTDENGKPSLNDLFKDEKKNVAEAVSKPVIKRNLKDIIDINDRFQFIQSLFGGSYLGFEEAVGTVSKQNNYSEALDFIDQKLKSTYNWDNDSAAVAKFLSLVEKCYDA